MRYGNPSIPDAISRLRAQGCERILTVPLYPQYAASTTATVVDAVTRHAARLRDQPEMRFIKRFHQEPLYLDPLAASIEAHWREHGKPQKLVMSFHGLPRYSIELGDPYYRDCMETARLLSQRLSLPREQIEVTFPEDYGVDTLAGKPATFDLKITAVKTSGETKIDEDFAKNLGLESLDQLRGILKGQLESETGGLTRTYMKRKLLDQLAAGHDFPVPPSMVEAEFNQIWAQLEHEASHEEDPEAAKKELEAEKGDYQAIAERRVRLGLLLSEIGQANGVEVTQAEMNRLIAQAAQQYPSEDQQRFVQYIQRGADGRSPSCARRCTRTRSSTSCSRRPRSPSAK